MQTTPKEVVVFIGLGSNQDSPIRQIINGIKAIGKLPGTTLIKLSSLYQTKPWGIIEQPDFINVVIQISSNLKAQHLLNELLQIELNQGRVRGEKNGPRTLDCDILLYGEDMIVEEGLIVPHPGMTSRATVLIPLAEIAPNLIIPKRGPVQHFLQQCDSAGVTKLLAEESVES